MSTVESCSDGARLTRLVAIVALAMLLLWPVAGSLPLARRNLHDWQRLIAARRQAPQTSLDRSFQSVGAYLPPRGRVGLVLLGSPRPDDAARTYYLLQYALAPREVVLDDQPEFVIAYGPESETMTSGSDSTLEIVKVLGDDLRLFRRVGR